MDRNKMYNELVHFVAGDALDKMSDAELKNLYEKFCQN